MILITILNHFISYLSKFINPPARNQETITFPEMIKVPYVSERVFYVWKHIVYHTNEPMKIPEILAGCIPSVLATEVNSSLVFKTKLRTFLSRTPKCTEREDSTRLPVAGAGGVPLCHFDLRYPVEAFSPIGQLWPDVEVSTGLTV